MTISHTIPSARAAARLRLLQFQVQGHGVQVAEENGRIYKIEFLGKIGRTESTYRALALRKSSRQVIATRDFGTVGAAKAWLEHIRIPNIQAG